MTGKSKQHSAWRMAHGDTLRSAICSLRLTLCALLFALCIFAQDDSRFEVFLRQSDNSPGTGKSVYIKNLATNDTTNLPEVSGKPGLYRADNVEMALYGVYSNQALLTTKFHATNYLYLTFQQMDPDGNYQVDTGGIEDQAVTASKLANTLDLSGKSVTLKSSEIQTAEVADSNITRPKLSTTVNVLLNNPGSGVAYPPDDEGAEFKIVGLDTSIGIKAAFNVVTDTTALKNFDYFLTNGAQVYLDWGIMSGWFIYKSSGSADHVTSFAASGGGIWERAEYQNDKMVNVLWAGAKGDNSTDDLTAIQNAIDVFSATEGYLYFPSTAQSIYKVSGTLDFSGTQLRRIKGENPLIRIQLTAADTLLKIAIGTHVKIEGLNFYGPGQATSSIGIYVNGGSGVSSYGMDQVRVSYFGVGIETSFLSGFVAIQPYVEYCGVGIGLGTQGDAITLIEPKANYCDTAFVVGIDRVTTGNAPINFINPWTQTSGVDYVIHDRNHLVNIQGWYSENADTLMIIEGNSGQNRVIMNGGWIQQLQDVGIVATTPILEITNMEGTISSIDTSFILMPSGGTLITRGISVTDGTTTGGHKIAGVKYGSFYMDIEDNLHIGKHERFMENVNGLSVYPWSFEAYNASGQDLFRVSRTTSAGVSQWDWTISDDGTATRPIWGASTGYVSVGNNTTGNPETAGAGNRGYLFGKDGTVQSPDDPDSLYINIYTGTVSTYDWYDLIRGIYQGNGASAGDDAFGAAALHDTVVIAGLTDENGSIIVATAYTSSPDSSTQLTVTYKTDSLFVHRRGTDSGALKYIWMRKEIR